MSKPRSRWWGTARQCVRAYPELLIQYNLLHESLGAAAMTGMPRGSGNSRSTENVALRTMSREDQMDFDAVRLAIEKTKLLEDGERRMELIRLVYWSRQRFTVEGAGNRVGWSEAQAKRKHGEFIKTVIKYLQNRT